MTTKRIAAVALAASAIIAQAPAHAEGVQLDRGFKSTLLSTTKVKAVKAKKTSKFAGHKGLKLDRKAPVVKAKAFKKKKVVKANSFKKAPVVKKKVVKAKSFKKPIVKKKVIKANSFKKPIVKKKIIKANAFKKPIVKKKAFKSNAFHNNRGFKAKTFKTGGFGYSPFIIAKLKSQALGACSAQLRHDAYQFGYKGVKLTDADVKQVGKNKFIVHAGAKLYDGYSFSYEPYNCTVAHGHVIDAYKPKKLKF